MVDYISQLPVDIFILHIITHLHFDDIISVSSCNFVLRKYCTSYSNNWKFLIDRIYDDVPNYQDHLHQLWHKLGVIKSYDYFIYTQLIKLLDPVDQAITYYMVGNTIKFNRCTNDQKFLAMILLHQKPNYLPSDDYLPFLSLKYNNDLDTLNRLLMIMVKEGSIRGVLLLLSKNLDIHTNQDEPLRWASRNGHTNLVKHLLQIGADIHANTDEPLRWGSKNGKLGVVKCLVEAGADVNANNDVALRWGSKYGKLDVVKYLMKSGANVHANNDGALKWALKNGHAKVVEVLRC